MIASGKRKAQFPAHAQDKTRFLLYVDLPACRGFFGHCAATSLLASARHEMMGSPLTARVSKRPFSWRQVALSCWNQRVPRWGNAPHMCVCVCVENPLDMKGWVKHSLQTRQLQTPQKNTQTHTHTMGHDRAQGCLSLAQSKDWGGRGANVRAKVHWKNIGQHSHSTLTPHTPTPRRKA